MADSESHAWEGSGRKVKDHSGWRSTGHPVDGSVLAEQGVAGGQLEPHLWEGEGDISDKSEWVYSQLVGDSGR
jgi:hypothetical protein